MREQMSSTRQTTHADCQTCGGRCCAGWTIDVLPGLDEVPDRMVKEDRLLGPVMRERNGACIALRDGRCSIYESRPKVCRDFEAGGDACRDRRNIPWTDLLKKVRRAA